MSLQFWLSLQGPVYDSLQHTVAQWNKSHLECQVELKNLQGLYGQSAEEALKKLEADQPAFVLAPEFMTSTMIGALGQKRVVPISEILDQEQLSKIAELVRRTFGDQDGRAVSLPFNPACGILYTNRDALKAAGKNPDYVPRSIEELEAVCKEMMAKKVVENGYTCAWPAAYLAEVPAAQIDLPLALPDNGFSGFGEYQLRGLKDHFLHLRQQVREGVLVYAGKDNNAKKPFIERKVAFFMQGSSHCKILQNEAKFEMGFGAIPTLTPGQKEKFAFPLGGASVWVLNNTQTQKMKEGVRAFLNYLASDDVQQKLHEETASVPVSRTLPPKLESFYATHPLHKAVVAQTIDARLGKYSFGIHMPNYAEARKELFDLIERILDVNKTRDDEVPGMLKEFDRKYSIEAKTKLL